MDDWIVKVILSGRASGRNDVALTRCKTDPTLCCQPGVIAVKVLVVDDSKVMREMVVACLRALPGAVFTHAASGLEAIEQLSLDAFDLVVLDLNMPDIGGLEVVEFVRGQDKLRELPIIVVTTRGDETSRTKALAAGASRFMTKPFTPDTILAEVRGLLRLEKPEQRA
jgi:two-component system, chemotaxis family, chemotaxis protein CheY